MTVMYEYLCEVLYLIVGQRSVKLLFCSKLIRIILSDGCLLLRYRSIKGSTVHCPLAFNSLYLS